MTGTALTEAPEFEAIYGLGVIQVPTNLPCVRIDSEDEVYRTGEEKFEAIINQIAECRERKQPVLVGTVSIEKSELLSAMLKKRKIALLPPRGADRKTVRRIFKKTKENEAGQ